MKHIKAIIWDLDGVKYPLDERLNTTLNQHAAQLAQRYLPHLSIDEAANLAHESYLKYHSGCDFLFNDYGLNREEVIAAYHTGVDISHLPKASEAYRKGIQASGVDHAILTHGDRNWANNMLTHLRIKDFFDDARMLTINDIYPHKKTTSTEPFQQILNIVDCLADQAIMVEDSAINLKHAKDLGITTVLVYPRKNYIQADYVDYVFATTDLFLDTFVSARAQNAATLKL